MSSHGLTLTKGSRGVKLTSKCHYTGDAMVQSDSVSTRRGITSAEGEGEKKKNAVELVSENFSAQQIPRLTLFLRHTGCPPSASRGTAPEPLRGDSGQRPMAQANRGRGRNNLLLINTAELR